MSKTRETGARKRETGNKNEEQETKRETGNENEKQEIKTRIWN